jgi:thiol-disulfide isomerase/thioredoxin
VAGACFLVAAAVLDYWPSSDALKWVTFEESKGLASSQNKPIFVDVYADWCQPCKLMDKQVFPEDSVKNILTNRYVLAKINGDDAVVGDTLRKLFGIKAYPTYIVLNSSGRERKRHIGFMPKSEMIKWLNDSIGVQILAWPGVDKALAVAQVQHRRVMVLILQSGDDLEGANAMMEDDEIALIVQKQYVPTLLVRGNQGEEKLLQRVGASPRTGMREVIVLRDDGKEVSRFFVNPGMFNTRAQLAPKLIELATR